MGGAGSSVRRLVLRSRQDDGVSYWVDGLGGTRWGEVVPGDVMVRANS